MRHPPGVAARRTAFALAAATLLLAVASPAAAAPCGHAGGDGRIGPATAPTAAAGPAVRAAAWPPAPHCGHCSPGTCAAAVSCGGQAHARPAALPGTRAPDAARLAPPADPPGPRSTAPPPDTPPPQAPS